MKTPSETVQAAARDAAREIANQFASGFFDDRMVDDIASIIARHMQQEPTREEPDRAAYLARWANAPEWAEWLSENSGGWCRWHAHSPIEMGFAWRVTGMNQAAGKHMLGRVACEPRPTPAVDPERAAYLTRWDGAPEWATHVTQDQGKECRWWRNQPSAYLTWVGKAATDTLEAYAPDNLLGSVRCEPRPEVKL